MPDHIIGRLRRFGSRYIPRLRKQFEDLVAHGQHPTVLYIGCPDSRVAPHLILDSGPSEMFIVRNVGNFVPPFHASLGDYGTVAAIE
jgi:carbonic anhydrase